MMDFTFHGRTKKALKGLGGMVASGAVAGGLGRKIRRNKAKKMAKGLGAGAAAGMTKGVRKLKRA